MKAALPNKFVVYGACKSDIAALRLCLPREICYAAKWEQKLIFVCVGFTLGRTEVKLHTAKQPATFPTSDIKS